MERRLVVMRHAKSSWSSDASGDHDRPLNGRGRKDAPRVARALVDLGWWPAVVVSSDSARTQETWALMAEAGQAASAPTPEVHFERGLYLAGYDELLADAASWEPEWTRVLVLGHNPGWQDLVTRLSGTRHEMTTANAALLVGAGASWAGALGDRWRLERFLQPKEL